MLLVVDTRDEEGNQFRQGLKIGLVIGSDEGLNGVETRAAMYETRAWMVAKQGLLLLLLLLLFRR